MVLDDDMHSSDWLFIPEAPIERLFRATRRVREHWLTYRQWMLDRGLDPYEGFEFPSFGDYDHYIDLWATEHHEWPPGFAESLKWSGKVVPWENSDNYYQFQWALRHLDYEFSGTHNYFDEVFAFGTGIIAAIAVRIMIAQSVWRCFHYIRRPGSGNFTTHRTGRKFIYPGHPDYES